MRTVSVLFSEYTLNARRDLSPDHTHANNNDITHKKGCTNMSETHLHTHMVGKIPHLGRLGNVVPEGYDYYEKLVTPGKDLSLPAHILLAIFTHPPDWR